MNKRKKKSKRIGKYFYGGKTRFFLRLDISIYVLRPWVLCVGSYCEIVVHSDFWFTRSKNQFGFQIRFISNTVHIIDVLWGQPIKLIQVASNSDCVKINGMAFFSLKLFPLIASGPQKPQKLTAQKIKYENFGDFQGNEFFEHLKYNFDSYCFRASEASKIDCLKN